MSKSSYRPDIDGLRAVAVLSVLTYHLRSAWLPGGFLGVDVFFVISGYLISGHIFTAALSREFSFANFYQRRINRILPALFGVLAFTLVATALLYLPDDFERVAKSAKKALTFTANAYFAKENDYFAHATAELPLLNLWSLSVEEQFYFFLPILSLLVLARARLRQRRLLIGAMIAGSLMYSEHLLRAGEVKFAYYFTLSRASELLVGTLLSTVNIKSISRVFGEAAGVLGLISLFTCFELISATSHFPGFLTLAPSLAAALLIFAGSSGSLISKALSWRPLVFIGLISYSLYLYHWPVMAMTRYITYQNEFSPAAIVVVTFASFSLSILSWRFIETPFRRNPATFRRAFSFRFLAPSLVALGVVTLIIKTHGLPQRYPDKNEVVKTLTFPGYCHEHWDYKNIENCRFGEKNQRSRILLLGDSIMGDYQPAFSEAGKIEGFSFVARSLGACYPVVQLPNEPLAINTRPECQEQIAWAGQHIDDFDTIVLAGNWRGYEALPTFPTYGPYLERSIKSLVARHKKVVILEQPPECPGVLKYYRQNFSLVSHWLGSQQHLECNTVTKEARQHMEALAKRTGAVFLPIMTQFASSENLPLASHKYLYYDDDHLNEPGGLELGRFLGRDPDLKRILEPESLQGVNL